MAIQVVLPAQAQTELHGANGLARFFIIDQSLDGVGGHHFDTVRLIARAAAERKFEVVAATNRKFDIDQQEFSEATTHTVFRNSTYTPFSQLGALRETTRSKLPFLDDRVPQSLLRRQTIDRWQRRILSNGQNRIIGEFAQDCDRLFSNYSLSESDHALFLTVNELDFMGLAAYLANNPNTVQAQWHVVFHFGIFAGRPSVYGKQKKHLDRIRYSIQSALARIPYHQISFLASTDELVEQYNQLNVGNFQMLPYPIDQSISNANRIKNAGDPVTLTLAGGLRREKGKKEINKVALGINELRKDGINIRLKLQKRKRKWFQRADINLELDHLEQNELIEVVPHPLPAHQYRELINKTDIGLLLYDNRTYYARRAGVLCEYLTAGCPVVVPAGCWLSHQIAEPAFRHIENLIKEKTVGKPVRLPGLYHSIDNVPLAGGVISFDHELHPFEASGQILFPSASLAVQFEWHWPKQKGTYASIEFMAFDSKHNELGRDRQIVGHRDELEVPNVLFRLPENTANYKLRFTNAYEHSTASLKNLCLTPVGLPGEQVAKGSVGFTFIDYDDVANAVAEVLNNYAHYAKTSHDFSRYWARLHDPAFTTRFLTEKPASLRYAA